MELHPVDNLTERKSLEKGDFPEARSLEHVLNLLGGKGTLIDAGANCGVFAVPAAAVGNEVMALEPNPIMSARLKRNIELNSLKITLREAALGPENGTATLNLRRNYGLSTLAQSDRACGQLEVEVRTLASLLEDGFVRPLVLKVDIEGFEDQALLPFFETAADDQLPDAILLETAHADKWVGNLIGAIGARGYRSSFKGEGNTFYFRQQEETPVATEVSQAIV